MSRMSKYIKPFPKMEKEQLKRAKISAKKVGVSKITNDVYCLVKVRSLNNIKDDNELMIRGNVYYIGNVDSVWVIVCNLNEWYKTSPIQKIEETKDGYIFETWNSIYKLEREKR